MVHAEGEAANNTFPRRAIMPLDCHGKGLKGSEPVSQLGNMPTDAFSVPVLDRGEDPDIAVIDGHHLCSVGRPGFARCLSDDRSIMYPVICGSTAMWRKKAIYSHKPQDALSADFQAQRSTKASEDRTK